MSNHRDHAHPSDCTDALKELYACLDGCLDPDRRRAIEAHVEKCHCCLQAFQFEARMLAAIKAPCAEDAAVAQLRQKVLQALRDQGFEPKGIAGQA